MTVIFLAQDQRFSVGSHFANAMIGRILERATEAEKVLLGPIVDDFGPFNWLVLDEKIAPEAFNCFQRLAREGFERDRDTTDSDTRKSEYYPGLMSSWEALLGHLDKDPRRAPAADG